ncbi:hypothetical protein BD410DRAFT_824773 [Rickenella mellea]|uniref:Uncharacterized protein n=1 Tax=Rickenella mellea TaxID=50990 RepID=A0A4Y7QL94_9AGAM|nr:hypothetical protein BD410DRAFT_824773 [Rickenella mellea]
MSQNIHNAAVNAVESGIYAAERTKQETSAATTATANSVPVSHDSAKQEANETVENVKAAASDAAGTAQARTGELGSQTSDATTQLKEGLAAKTNEAAVQGKQDVQSTAAAGAGYVEQAKYYANAALATAQEYVAAGQAKIAPAPESQGGIAATVQSAASTALGTTKSALASAQATLQPHVDNAVAAAQPHIDNAKAAAQPHIDNAMATAQPHIDNAKATAQPYVDSMKQTVNSAAAAAQPHVDAASAKVSELAGRTGVAGEGGTTPATNVATPETSSNTTTIV